MRNRAIHLGLLLLAGCSTFSGMTWAQFKAFGDVRIGEPERSGRTLRIAAHLDQKAGDSISVLSYLSHISGDTIFITAVRAPMGSTSERARDTIVVNLPARPLSRYRIVYESPDGVREPIAHVDVPDPT